MGIKCEIHSCTLEFAKQFLNEFFNPEEMDFMGKSLKSRVDSQYYIDRSVPDDQYQRMIQSAPNFLVKCKSIQIKLTENKIKEIREKFRLEIQLQKSR